MPQARLSPPKSHNTDCQEPSASARRGAKKTATLWPMLPAPKIPRAVPCCSGANHLLVKATPTEKVVPAIPRKKPHRSRAG
ncbi:hypothetical protein D3C87_1734520 [compost metagenome]